MCVCVCERERERERWREAERQERMVMVDGEFSLLLSTGFMFHLGLFSHQGMPKSQTSRFFPWLHPRAAEPDLVGLSLE